MKRIERNKWNSLVFEFAQKALQERKDVLEWHRNLRGYSDEHVDQLLGRWGFWPEDQDAFQRFLSKNGHYCDQELFELLGLYRNRYPLMTARFVYVHLDGKGQPGYFMGRATPWTPTFDDGSEPPKVIAQ
ncbi:MAG: hypothetical protein JRI22_22620, partial [Deltaproteobacteria bacterium]|nr:hypothetical protein [Deltaproteobacteria bacterium]